MRYARAAALLLSLSLAGRVLADPPTVKPILYPAAIFVRAKDRSPSPDDIAAIQKAFPDLKIATDLKAEPSAGTVRMGYVSPEEFQLPDARRVHYMGIDLTPAQAEWLTTAGSVWVVEFAIDPQKSIAGVKQADLLLQSLADRAGDSLLYDDTTRRYYSPAAWKRLRIDSWQGDLPNAASELFIDFYQTEAGPFRGITMGMAKFGRAEVVCNDMVQGNSQSMGSLMGLVAQAELEPGGPVDVRDETPVKIDLHALRHDGLRKTMLDSLKPNATATLQLAVKPAKHEEGDPSGPLVEMVFPGSAETTELQDAALSQLFGAADQLIKTKHDQALLDARDRARKKLPDMQARFNKGLAVGDRLIIKGPFKTPDGGNEWMWVEVTAWPGNTISGVLENEPVNVPNLKSGAHVTVDVAEVFDYLLYHADGTHEGGETSDILAARAGDKADK